MGYRAKEIAFVQEKLDNHRCLEEALREALTYIRRAHDMACNLYGPNYEPGIMACIASCAGKFESQRLMASGMVRWYEEKLRVIQPVAPVEVEDSGL